MSDDRLLIRVVRGAPTEEELAAVTAVLCALARAVPAGPPQPRRVHWLREFDYQTGQSWRAA